MVQLFLCIRSGSGVTANMPALGAGDSGFESRLPDYLSFLSVFFLCVLYSGTVLVVLPESSVRVTYTLRVRVTPGSSPGSPTLSNLLLYDYLST